MWSPSATSPTYQVFPPPLESVLQLPHGGQSHLGISLGYFFQLWAFLVALMVKNLPAMQETWVQSLGQEDALEQGMATHSSILAWRIPWTEEPGRLQSWGQQRGTTERLNTFTFISFNWSTCPSCPSLNLADLPMPLQDSDQESSPLGSPPGGSGWGPLVSYCCQGFPRSVQALCPSSPTAVDGELWEADPGLCLPCLIWAPRTAGGTWQVLSLCFPDECVCEGL